MEYGRAPQSCIKSVADYIADQEKREVTLHGKVITRKASAADIAKLEEQLAAKDTMTVDICAELGFKRKPEKSDLPFEEMGRKPKGEEVQYRPRFYDRVAG